MIKINALILLFLISDSMNSQGETIVSMPDILKKRDLLTNEINSKKDELKNLQNSYDSKIKNANKRSGYSDKYIRENYDNNSFYNTITKDEVTAYAQLAANVYEKSIDKSLAKKDLNKLSYENQIDNIQLLIKFLNNIKDDLINNEFKQEVFTDLIKKNFKENNSFKLEKIDNKEDALNLLLNIENEKLTEKETLEIKLEQISDPYIEVMQKLPALSVNGLFKDAKVISSIRRNSGEFSGVLVYIPSRDEVIIVFAGTKSWFDWFKNFQYWGSQGDPLHGIGKGLNVHTGVMKVVKEGLNGIIREISKMTKSSHIPSKITTTGHSLAGGLSTLFAHYIKTSLLSPDDNQKTQIRNINFASLRIVDEPSAQKMEDDLGKGNILRFWNKWDVVPAVTPGFLNSKHVGLDFMIEDSLWREIYKPFINWHSMTFYYNHAANAYEKISNEAQERKTIETSLSIVSNEIEQKDKELQGLSKLIANLRKNTLGPEIKTTAELLSSTKEALNKLKNQIKNMTKQELASLPKNKASEMLSEIENLKKLKKELQEKLHVLEWEQIKDEEFIDKKEDDNTLEKLKLLQEKLQKPAKKGWFSW